MEINKDQLIGKLLEVIGGNIEAMNLLRHEIEGLKKDIQELKQVQQLGGLGGILRGGMINTPQPQVITTQQITICQHEYPTVWASITPPPCSKCGAVQNLSIAINTSSNSAMPNMQELLDDLNIMLGTKD